MSLIVSGLNDAQKEAALYTEGPLLVLAGAGSGKTKALTHRIAYMLEKGVRPWNIMALTFTNKAAEEMRIRIAQLVGPIAEDLWMSTFHSACVRILRRDIEVLGYSSGFNIYDSDDQVRLIRHILKAQNIDIKKTPPKSFAVKFDDAKRQPFRTPQLADYLEDKYDLQTKNVFLQYQKRMKQNNVVDFNDLINFTIHIFQDFPEILSRRQRQFQYLMVDEYQDTNASQYALIRLLSSASQNIAVVGDDDQSIYGFRGADIENILRFQQDFVGAKVVRLERNYRSTKNILNAANAVVSNNSQRMEKTMWTEAEEGKKIQLIQVRNEWDEAESIQQCIQKLLHEGHAADDMAIIYRTNAQSSIFEQVFTRARLPHVLVGARKFYDRAEIKDLISYLKLVLNPNDEIAFFRAVNTPRRGIGPKSIEQIVALAEEHHMGIVDAADLWGSQKKAKSRTACLNFCELIYGARDQVFSGVGGVELLEMLDKKIKYREGLRNEDSIESLGRLENIERLFEHLQDDDQEKNPQETKDPLFWLQNFLDNAALVAGSDDLPDKAQKKITLLTAHLSKGLEFPIVFVVGMNEGSFPHSLSMSSEKDIEEERRLVYVAFTRAQKRLILSRSRTRRPRGKVEFEYTDPSRFLKELPKVLIFGDASPKRSSATPQERSKRLGFSKHQSSEPRKRFGQEKGKRLSALPKDQPAKGLNRGRGATGTDSSQSADLSHSLPSEYRTMTPESPQEFQVGVEVVHSKFGLGKIIQREGSMQRLKLKVRFQTSGEKTLLAQYSNLEIIIR